MTQLRSIRQSLMPEVKNTLAQALVNDRLDYCNGALVGISNQRLQRMQMIQNAAACFVTGIRAHDASVT